MSQTPTALPSHQQGVVLLESLIAVLIFSFGVLALAGLQASMIKNTDEARYRAEAAFIAQDTISNIWIGGSPNLADYKVTDKTVSQLPSGKVSVDVVPELGGAMVEVTVNWTLPGGAAHTYLAKTRVERNVL